MRKYTFIFSYLKKWKLLLLLFLVIFSSALTLLPPYIISYILDNGVVKSSTTTIVYSGLFLLFIYACSFLVNYFISQTLTKASNYFIADLKNDLLVE